MNEKKTIDLKVNFGLAIIVVFTEYLFYKVVEKIIERKKEE